MNYVSHLIVNYENLKNQNTVTPWMTRYVQNPTPSNLDFKEFTTPFTIQSTTLAHKTPSGCISRQTILDSPSLPKYYSLKGIAKNENILNSDKLKLKSYLYTLNNSHLLTKFNVSKLWYLLNEENEPSYHHLNSLYNNINMHFLRKERLYTKLKYSRTPSYDIVSGGAAALLAAFFGFLILEKFGFELVDSGDFWYLVMYVGVLVIALKGLVTTLHYDTLQTSNILSIFSPKHIFNFYFNFLYIILKCLFKK